MLMRMQRSRGATPGMRMKSPRDWHSARVRRAKSPSRHRSMVTKFVADSSGLRPFARAMAASLWRPRAISARTWEPVLIGQGDQGADLGGAGHAEMIAQLVEGLGEGGFGDRIADAGARHAVTL